jgi:hypothetical protein
MGIAGLRGIEMVCPAGNSRPSLFAGKARKRVVGSRQRPENDGGKNLRLPRTSGNPGTELVASALTTERMRSASSLGRVVGAEAWRSVGVGPA